MKSSGGHIDVHRGQLGGECCQCHNETNWVPGGLFALHNRTRFPLVGAHTGMACFRCHPGAQVGNFLRAPTRCEVCHQQELKRAKNPDHIAQGWTQDCQQCHELTTWMISVFSHAGITNGCVACHFDNYLGTTSPNHAALGFPTAYEACHNTNAFR